MRGGLTGTYYGATLILCTYRTNTFNKKAVTYSPRDTLHHVYVVKQSIDTHGKKQHQQKKYHIYVSMHVKCL